MRQLLRTLIPLFAVMALAACSDDNTQTSNPTPLPSDAAAKADEPGLNVCKMLTSEEIQAVQGEALVSSKRSGQTGAGLTVSQCYFELPQAVNSLVVTVMQKAPGATDVGDPAKKWEGIFHREEGAKKEEGSKKGDEEGEMEPEKVEGIGDEAFWTGTRVGGALYVLKGNNYIRISIGGTGDQADKIRKSKALAQHILGRLSSFSTAKP